MDWDEITKLLDIMDGTRGLPKLKPIHDLAELTLIDLVEDAQENLDERKAKATEEQAKADAEAQAKLEAEQGTQEEETGNARRA